LAYVTCLQILNNRLLMRLFRLIRIYNSFTADDSWEVLLQKNSLYFRFYGSLGEVWLLAWYTMQDMKSTGEQTRYFAKV